MQLYAGETGIKNRIIFIYVMLLTFHTAHVFEETWGRFWLLNTMGLGFFLSVNLILFFIALLFLCLVILQKKIGYLLTLVYASIMVLNGIVHNLAVIITGKYFGGYAGSFSGIGLVVLGALLSWHIIRYACDKKRLA